jgi:hypothetical protein
MVSLRARILGGFAILLVLAIGGEFVGAARRRTLRREVPDATPPTLLPGQVEVRVKGPDGLPVPQGAAALITTHRTGPRTTAVRGNLGFSSGFLVLAAPDAGGGSRWVEIRNVSDYADQPLPFGAVLVGPLPEGATTLEVVLPPEQVIAGSIREAAVPVMGARVRARRVYAGELEALEGRGGEGWLASATTGPDGRFELRQLGPGPHEVDFAAPSGTGIARRRVEAGLPLHVDLATEAAPTITIVDAKERPVGNAAIHVIAPEGKETLVQGVSDWNGRFRVFGLDPRRTYRLSVALPGGPSAGPVTDRDWRPSDVTVKPDARR